MASETFLASFGQIGLRLIERLGISPQEFTRPFGLDVKALPGPKARLPVRFGDETFARIASLVPDPAFALHSAECWHPSNLGTLGYAWLSSETLRAALARLTRYAKIVGEKATCRCMDRPNGLHLIYESMRGNSLVGYVMADFAMAIMVDMCRTNFGPSLALESVYLRRPRPVGSRPYEDFYGCPVTFGEAEDGFVLGRHVADKPLPTANQELATTFDAILAAELAKLGSSDIEARARAYLLEQLTSGEPSEALLAREMGMSSRTLQRKLGELELTYRSVLEKTRYDLALRYLDDPAKTITDITFLLGFSEQSAFARAFKRWSGKTPSSCRRR